MSGRDSDGRTKCNYSFQLWTLVNGDEPLPTAAQSKGLIFFMHRKRKYTKTQNYTVHVKITFSYLSSKLKLRFLFELRFPSLNTRLSIICITHLTNNMY